MDDAARTLVDTGTYRELMAAVSNWGRWGPADERGALNYVTPEKSVAATRLVTIGRSISLARTFATREGVDNRKPAVHAMTHISDESDGAHGWNTDFIGADYHGKAITHVDALAHCSWDGALYNGFAQRDVGSGGVARAGITAAAQGVVSRGVLLDVPRHRRAPWLEPGTTVGLDELRAVESAQQVLVGSGDVVLLRTGHEPRQRALGLWNSSDLDVGLDVGTARWLHEAQVAVLGSDGDSDTSPSTVDGVRLPIHVLALTAMGVMLMDNLALDDLAAACEAENRWEFLFVMAPLRIAGGTGSPVNPIAVM